MIEPDAEVAIEAERQTDGLAFSCRDPVPLPSELVPGPGSVGPLDDRTLHGCRLGDSPKAVDSTFDADECRRLLPFSCGSGGAMATGASESAVMASSCAHSNRVRVTGRFASVSWSTESRSHQQVVQPGRVAKTRD